MSEKKRIPIPESLTQGGLQTQPETLAVSRKRGKMSIGIPKEITPQEHRIALVPSSIAALVAYGHRVVVEKEAGKKANYTDHRFSEAGAEIAYSAESVYRSDIIIKVAPPTLDEIELMRPGQILITPLQLPSITQEYLYAMKAKRVIALAMEYIQDENGIFPIVRIMSEMAGVSAMLTAAQLMTNAEGGKGVLLAGISGVPSAKVVILGAGVVAQFATRVALGLGAEVRIFDNNVSKLMRIQTVVGQSLNTSTLNPFQLRKEVISADVVIGAMHSTDGRTPIVVTEDIVMEMKRGAVIIDVSIDQGGCFETSRLTSHANPTFVEHDVIHYCVPNIGSRVARTASIAVSNILTPILQEAGNTGSIERLLYTHAGLRHGVYMYKGTLTNEYLSRRFNMKCTGIELLLTAAI